MSVALANTETMTRDEWLKFRNRGIGGSDVSVICGVNKYKSPVELWMEKTGQIEPKEAGEAAYWGTILEPIIRDEFSKRSGMEVALERSILQHPYHSFMMANLDGIVIDPVKNCTCVFEAKTANQFSAGDWELDVPEGYQLQVQHYMAVTDYTGTYIAVLIGGNQFRYYYIERDDEMIGLLIMLEKHFWDCVIKKIPPKIDGSKASSELLNRLYPQGKSKTVIPLPEDALDLIKQYEDGQTGESSSSLKKDEAANKLKSMLGTYEYGSISNRTVCWTNVNSEKFNSKAFKLADPETYTKFVVKSSFRRFSIK